MRRGHTLYIVLQSHFPTHYRQIIIERNISIIDNTVGEEVPHPSSPKVRQDLLHTALTGPWFAVYEASGELFPKICLGMLEDT